MKRISLQRSLWILRICIVTTIIVIISLFLLSFKIAEKRAEDFWKQLGMTQQQGSEKIKTSFMYGYVNLWGAKNAKNIVAGNRAAVAQDLLNYTKTYLNSAAFKDAYAKEKAKAKPTAPEIETVSKEAIRKQQIDDLKKGIKNTQELMKTIPSMEKDGRKSIEDMEKSIKEYEKPDNEIINLLYQGEVERQKMKQKDYENDLVKWEENYPQNPQKKISGYLKKYLSIANTVDFDAALTEKYNKKVFVKKEYEYKSSDWKMIFRAGKEVYNVTKPFAEQWLKELP